MLERLGDYQILEMIGSGALGTVYRAQDTVSDSVVAIEVIDPTLAANSEFLEELQIQIELAKLLDHPNITPVQDFATEDGTTYLVTEYISDSLAQRLASGRRFSWRQSVSIALQTSRALEHAHRNEIFHLDVNPENIRFRPDGSLTVSGFGIALAWQRSNAAELAIGNANYRSPEQWSQGPLDSRTDVYSLGITLYQMLEGNLPFDGDDEAAAEAWHRGGSAPSFTESLQVPRVVAEVIERAIEKSPGSRHESAETMSLALEDILSGRAFDPPASIAARTSPLRPINSPPEMVPVTVRPSRSSSKNASRRNLFALAGVAALVVIAIFVGVTVIGFGDDETSVQAAQRSTPTPSDNGSDEPGSEGSTDGPLATVEPNGSQNDTPSVSGTPEPTEVPDATTVPVPTPSISLTPSPTATPRPTPTPVFLDEYTQGLIYLSEQDYGSAIVEFDSAIEYDPSIPEVYEARAVAYAKLGQFLPAVEDYAEAISLNPSKATLYRDRANALTFLGLDRLAILDYQQAVTLDPEIPGGYRGMGQAWARADILSVTEDLTPQGIEAFGQALRLFPNDFEAAKGRALLNMRRGLFDAAIEEFTFLIDANPSDQLDTTYRRSLSYYAIGFYSQAIADANRIISIDLYNSEYFYVRSAIYTSLAEAAASQSDLETSCALNPVLTEDQIRLGADSTLEGILPFRICPVVPADLVPTLEPSP